MAAPVATDLEAQLFRKARCPVLLAGEPQLSNPLAVEVALLGDPPRRHALGSLGTAAPGVLTVGVLREVVKHHHGGTLGYGSDNSLVPLGDLAGIVLIALRQCQEVCHGVDNYQ